VFDKETADLFWSQVDKPNGEGGCWFFRCVRFSAAFAGEVKKYWQPHQVAYILTYGPIPSGQLVRHLCTSRDCMNPAHLRAGTQQENMWDYAVRRMFEFEPGELVGYEDVPEYIPPPFRRK
jgi:hypothetical protein